MDGQIHESPDWQVVHPCQLAQSRFCHSILLELIGCAISMGCPMPAKVFGNFDQDWLPPPVRAAALMCTKKHHAQMHSASVVIGGHSFPPIPSNWPEARVPRLQSDNFELFRKYAPISAARIAWSCREFSDAAGAFFAPKTIGYLGRWLCYWCHCVHSKLLDSSPNPSVSPCSWTSPHGPGF